MTTAPPTLYLNIAELIVCRSPAIVSTVLGSCVSVCLFNRSGTAGGIIHYALPEVIGNPEAKDGLRYGEIAIETLVREMEKATGEPASSFQAKIAGGASESKGATVSLVGTENVAIARRMLAFYKIPIVGESVGGVAGRKILFHVLTGRLQVAKLSGGQPEMKRPMSQPLTTAIAKPNAKMTAQPIAKATNPSAPKRRRRVLVVDDSKTIRELLKKVLSEDPELEVVGFAPDPLVAQKMLLELKPDVITLDIHMPHMTGVEWLAKILPTHPVPVVMISSLQLQEGNEVFMALELGAVDYIQKPSLQDLSEISIIIREKVKAASYAKVVRHKAPQQQQRASFVSAIDPQKILAIGASTGGTEAIKSVLLSLPEKIPPTVIVQHIPAVFSKAFADRLNVLCPFEVKEAVDGDEVKPNRVLIAPGGMQMSIHKSSKGMFVRVVDDPPMNRHKPSVDYLFNSVASLLGDRAVGVILTGMGADGAKGLLEMRKKGAHTIGQDEESCVVYGMPKAAFEIGAVAEVVRLSLVPSSIIQSFSKRERKKVS